jgi:hypothetical protein
VYQAAFVFCRAFMKLGIAHGWRIEGWPTDRCPAVQPVAVRTVHKSVIVDAASCNKQFFIFKKMCDVNQSHIARCTPNLFEWPISVSGLYSTA